MPEISKIAYSKHLINYGFRNVTRIRILSKLVLKTFVSKHEVIYNIMIIEYLGEYYQILFVYSPIPYNL
ncbi:MAG: hypothetical protein ACTSSB_11960, partial [Candidatus Heimdallarchaeota archaeon]